MDVRAAVAVQARKPLEVMPVRLEGPRAGEALIEVKATGNPSLHGLTPFERPDGAHCWQFAIRGLVYVLSSGQ